MRLFELIAAAIAVAGTGIVGYIDHKTGYMPDKYTHAMIIAGLALLFLAYPLEQALVHCLVAAVVLGVSFLAYVFGQLGGGDVKLFTGLSLLLPIYPITLAETIGLSPVIAPYPFIISVFFAAAVLSMLFVSGDYALRLLRDRAKVKGFKDKAIRGLLYSALSLPLAAVWLWLNPKMAIVALPLCLGTFIIAFKDEILRLYVVKKKAVKDLNDDDVLALELMSKPMQAKLGLVGGRKTFLSFELDSIKASAKKNGVKEVLVNEYLPKFGPFIVASLVINLLVGDALLWLLFI